jgi:large subunit ribosomal protein L32
MQAPKKKQSQSRRDMRRAHDFLVPENTTKCQNCSANVRQHSICGECGFYRGRFFVKASSQTAVEAS